MLLRVDVSGLRLWQGWIIYFASFAEFYDHLDHVLQ